MSRCYALLARRMGRCYVLFALVRRCAGGRETWPPIKTQLVDGVLQGQDPMAHADPRAVDNGYPHTNLRPELARAVLTAARDGLGGVGLYVEVGSMLGGSVRVAGQAALDLGLGSHMTLVSIDPFTGDANMWADRNTADTAANFSFLQLRHDQPTIYERYLANTVGAGLADMVVPLRATSTVGLRLLARLRAAKRVAELPTVLSVGPGRQRAKSTFLGTLIVPTRRVKHS